ncbi:MAG: serine/threonine protein kinase/Flp pilus assembly protein TadD [Planctomycetota bacterium]|jgi:serine/threonine protein kinase/Flp pilus assembly protein TadD
MQECLHCGHASKIGARFCPECGTKFGESKPGRQSLIGHTLSDKYRVVRELGSGGMGTVYLAEHTSLKKLVAVKVLHPDLYVSAESIQRFQREGIAAGQFTHAGAIQIFDFDKDESGVFYLAMEYVEGRSLGQLLREEGKIDVDRATDIIQQVLRVLAEAHRHGIIHRDLKPDNIMILPSADRDQVKVLDFGLSKLVDVPLKASLVTQTGRIMGTPQYMSPEQCAGKDVDARSDLYATALVMHELLSGEPTFGGDSIPEILVKHTTEPPPSLVDTRPELNIPADLDAWIVRALAKSPDDRFQTANEMLEGLESVRRDHYRKVRKQGRSWNLPVSPIGLALGAVVVLLLVVLSQSGLLDGVSRPSVDLVSMLTSEDRSADENRYVQLVRDARRALRQRDTDMALVAIEDAMQMPCRDAEAFLVRALIYTARSDQDAAMADADEALRLYPSYADVVAWRGWILMESGAWDEADTLFEKAVGMQQACALALAGKGAIAMIDSRDADAEDFLKRAIAIDDEEVLAHSVLGMLRLRRGEHDEAVTSFVRAKRADASYWRAWSGLGEAYIALERFEDAEKQLKEAIGLNPGHVDSRSMLASLLIDMGRTSDASDLIQESVQRFPESADLQLLQGVLHAEEDRADAISALEQAIEIAPAAAASMLLGQLLLEEERFEDAIRALDDALSLSEDLALPSAAWRDRGLALFRLERFDEAIVSFTKATEADPEEATSFLDLGILQMVYGEDKSAARTQFERYRDLGGSDERIDVWLQTL